MRKFLLFLFILILLFIGKPQIVSAQNSPLPAIRKLYQANVRNSTPSGIEASISALRKQARADLLTVTKLKACEARQDNIQKRSSQMVRRATNQEDVFTKIAGFVEQFYQNKLVPQGKTVANYDALVADISAKKDAITPLVQTAKTDAANFNCSGSSPNGQIQQFNTDMKAVIAALEAYRTSVRNLIVAVKSVVGAANSAANSASQSAAQ